MKRRWRFGLCITAILWGAQGSVAQGLVWQTEMKSQQMGTQQTTTAYMPGMLAVSNLNAGGDGMVFRFDRKMIYFLKHSEKKVNTVTFDDFEAQMADMGRVVDAQMTNAMKELANLPAEQRALIEKQLGGLMPKKEEGSVTVTQKGEKKSIAGFAAVRYVATRNGEQVLTAWTTTAIPGWNRMKKEFSIFTEKMSGVNLFGRGFVDALKQIEGFPLEIEAAGFASTVTNVEMKTTPAADFEIPAGYTVEQKKLFDGGPGAEREE